MTRKTTLTVVAVAAIATALGIAAWRMFFSPTRIAFINYQVITLGEIARANDLPRVELTSLDAESLDDVGRFDFVLVNGMGLRITAEQRDKIRAAADKGVGVVTTMATNPANDITTADSATVATIKSYLDGGGRRNYRSLLAYIRQVVGGTSADGEAIEPPAVRETKLFYHPDPASPDDEWPDFDTLADYEAFLSKNGLMRPGAPRIVLTGQMGQPENLIAQLEKTGNVVYPVRSFHALLEGGMADSIAPSAMINMAHGRMGDAAVDFLRRRDIPLFAPLNVNRLVTEWEDDKMGMSGGFLSQSVVTPEIDGAIRPYALFGHYAGGDGLHYASTIEGRLEKFVEAVNRHVSLRAKPNSEKRVAIYYNKGPGQSGLTAAGMEVGPSLFNLLVKMKAEGYRVDNLPATADELGKIIARHGSVFNAYATGAKQDFLRDGSPELISRESYEAWASAALRPQMVAAVEALDGAFPGSYLSTRAGELALPRIWMGNVVLLPQLAAGAGSDDFAIVHGTDTAPPHAYVASYLWARYGFRADVMVHFGTHGSLEFTPHKQVALSDNDWSDALVGPTPHLYVYAIDNVGEGVIAKRRSYATLQTYLTPPFLESDVRGVYRELSAAIGQYNDLLYADGAPDADAAARKVKRLTVELGIHRELRLDSAASTPYTEREIARIEAFAEELASEKITGELYTMGVPYREERIRSTVLAMATEPIAYSTLALDKLRGRATADAEKHRQLFTRRYLKPARDLATRLLDGDAVPTDATICAAADITADELEQARRVERAGAAPRDMMSAMARMRAAAAHRGGGRPAPDGKADGHSGATVREAPTKEEKERARAIVEIERTIRNVGNYRRDLETSPGRELNSLVGAMAGGYTHPSPGGDPIVNPNSLPTGRNLFAINAEATPSERAWERGKALTDEAIRMYRERHHDSIPRKMSYTLWSGEFIETEGATIAQVLYALGVEPIRDVFGRVTDLRLIPSEELGRPRIDVVVQTSGQLRDIAASRLFLVSRAVEMAAAATDDKFDNFVARGVVDSERALVEKGVSAKEAREASSHRVFGGLDGHYGTGIAGMVLSGDRWESRDEIAAVYLHNMGAYYGSEKEWEQVRQYALEAALTNTDAVIQPRQSNTWGALSLDHVYEFMGGLNLGVRHVTGKDPDAYLSDYRNRNNTRMQELKEAIGVESRTTIFNPAYIREKMGGQAGSANAFAEIVQNAYGWNVMKPDVVDNELWDEVYAVYVDDKFGLGLRSFFESQNPAALEEISAVMMETARKGMWRATPGQLAGLAALHTELVARHGASCSGFVCGNAKLNSFVARHAPAGQSAQYEQTIRDVREASATDDKGVVLRREQVGGSTTTTNVVSDTVVATLIAAVAVALVVAVRRRRRKMEE